MESFEDIVRKLLEHIGEDPKREGLIDTPRRVADAWREWGAGYAQDDLASIMTLFEDGAADFDEMVFQTSIPFFSHCEHHLAPFFGLAHIAYIPNGRVIGLSKMPRLLEVFARRLQIQERLSNQVADAMDTYLKPRGVGIVIQARHLCMESRGIQKIGTVTMTSALRGVFKTAPEVRAEFLALVNTAVQGVRVL